MKCCGNGCGYVCQEPVFSTSPCTPGSCGVNYYTPVLCPNGTTTGPYCERNSLGQCKWTFHPCPPVAPPRTGQCPVTSGGDFGSCEEQCQSDSDCEQPLKCCSNGCGNTCQQPVPECATGGYRGQICGDPYEMLSINYRPTNQTEQCLRCTNYGVCGRTNVSAPCNWSDSYFQCLATCNQSTSVPRSSCSNRTTCGCFSDPSCGWCQIYGTVQGQITTTGSTNSSSSNNNTSVTSTNIPFDFGFCLHTDFSMKCTGNMVSGSYGGQFVPTTPQVCIDIDLGSINENPNLYPDASGSVKNALTKLALKLINEGYITEELLQSIIDLKQNGSNWNMVVNKILQATLNANGTTTLNAIIDIESPYPLSDEEIKIACTFINHAYAQQLQTEVSQLDYCTLTLLASPSQKRDTGTTVSQFVHTTEILASSTNQSSQSSTLQIFNIPCLTLILSLLFGFLFV